MTLFMNNMCAVLHFFSMCSLTDRFCGYLPFVPFSYISCDGHKKNIDAKARGKEEVIRTLRLICHTPKCLCYSSKFCRNVRSNINPLLKSTLSVYVNIF